MRKNVVVGNWKMNLNRKEAIMLVEEVLCLLPDNSIEVVFAPSNVYLYKINKMCLNFRLINTAAQNICSKEKGAFTGEVSASMVNSLSVKYTILGHSERRLYYNETNEDLRNKVDIALSNNLQVIFCCGESSDHRDLGAHFDWVRSQLEESVFHLDIDNLSNIVLAYEPIWAIGTGVTASPTQAEEMHCFIRNLVADKYSLEVADNITILYGGSCNPNNAKELFALENVDGGLIGGASLDSKSFIDIIKSF